MYVSGPWINFLKWHEEGLGFFFDPTNVDLADVLGRMDLVSDNSHLFDVSGFHISRCSGSQIS